jgi:hypothetical protein
MVISSDCHAASNTDHRQPITDYSLVLGLALRLLHRQQSATDDRGAAIHGQNVARNLGGVGAEQEEHGIGHGLPVRRGLARIQALTSSAKPGILLAAVVASGPADTAFTRTPSRPWWRAKARTTASSAALCTPIQLRFLSVSF